MPRANVECVLPNIGWMLRMRNIRIKQLIFHHVEAVYDGLFLKEDAVDGPMIVWDGSVHKGIRRLAVALHSLAPVCAELRLYQSEFSCSDQIHGDIPQAAVQLDAPDVESQLWDLYETRLPRDEVNVKTLAERIHTGPKGLRRVVAKCLNDWQSSDPRSTTQYRDREWTVENTQDVDLSRLTALTLRALKDIVSGGWRWYDGVDYFQVDE
ncbi:uncharacterized protein LOC129595491 [Paramacrobiotus metropolitanus]|uniref:uncharacterized protein LOC129595491 n=1 Tax=Paramacrobiotus metropolitanus TaxID=2943436 RepID=UPI002445E55F|nr:uncharacterized protein LOC129595491 [Paramacrobiotus metropolitanus]